jgi:predicted PurR-regulated permease PerM
MPPAINSRSLLQILLAVLAIAALALLLWTLRNVFILVFGSVVLAVILRVIANPLKKALNLPDKLALLLSILLVTGIIALALWLFGQDIGRQAETLQRAIPSAWQSLLERLETLGLAEPLRQWLQLGGGGGVVDSFRSVLLSVTNAVADAVLVVAGAIYLAADPLLYRRGLVKLAPEPARGRMDQALNDCWVALRLWLLGRFATMIMVGLLVGIGLWLLDMPAALTLGIAAGLLEFVPFAGPIVAAIPAVLLALTASPTTAVLVLCLYLLVQQLEGNVITPLVQQRAVSLPPALLLFALVALGLLFGIIGILLAEPLTVVVYVLVKRLYIQEYLHTPTAIPGQAEQERSLSDPG